MANAENLKAQLKCVQSDIFTALKRYIKIFSFDPALKEIVNQPYCTINKNKYTLGLDGERVYGVIDNYSPEKRNDIVKQVKNHLLKSEIDNARKKTDMELIILNYQQAGDCIENTTLVDALENRLRAFRLAYAGILKYEKVFGPKCLN